MVTITDKHISTQCQKGVPFDLFLTVLRLTLKYQ